MGSMQHATFWGKIAYCHMRATRMDSDDIILANTRCARSGSLTVDSAPPPAAANSPMKPGSVHGTSFIFTVAAFKQLKIKQCKTKPDIINITTHKKKFRSFPTGRWLASTGAFIVPNFIINPRWWLRTERSYSAVASEIFRTNDDLKPAASSRITALDPMYHNWNALRTGRGRLKTPRLKIA